MPKVQGRSLAGSVPEFDRLPAGCSSPKDFAIVMAVDAFRICLGGKPKNKPEHVLLWMKTMLETK